MIKDLLAISMIFCNKGVNIRQSLNVLKLIIWRFNSKLFMKRNDKINCI